MVGATTSLKKFTAEFAKVLRGGPQREVRKSDGVTG